MRDADYAAADTPKSIRLINVAKSKRPARSMRGVDKPFLYISVALAVTLLLFAMDVIPYPFGLIVLTLLALGRFLQIKGPA